MTAFITEIERVERLGHIQKVRHWSQPEPWHGLKVLNRTVFEAKDVRIDSNGDITEQPLLVGKPCFGQPIVLARQGLTLKRRSSNGMVYPTRCGRCKVREACTKVSQYRLFLTTESRDTYLQFMGKGGAQALQEKHLKVQAQVLFDLLVRHLVRHGPFNSVNDAKVLAHYDLEGERRKVQDADRKRAERAKRRANGYLDKRAMDLLASHRMFRRIKLTELLVIPTGLPSRLAKLPPASVEITADAWHAREVLRHTKATINGSSIARAMMKAQPDRYHNFESLRQRTPTDLDRVDLLERFAPQGAKGPVWPPFNLLKEMADEEKLTPYGNFDAD